MDNFGGRCSAYHRFISLQRKERNPFTSVFYVREFQSINQTFSLLSTKEKIAAKIALCLWCLDQHLFWCISTILYKILFKTFGKSWSFADQITSSILQDAATVSPVFLSPTHSSKESIEDVPRLDLVGGRGVFRLMQLSKQNFCFYICKA